MTAAAALAVAAFPLAVPAQSPEAAGLPVHVAPVVREEIHQGQWFPGTVEPSLRAVIGSAVDGRVIEFPLKAGDRVAEGGKLAQLLTETVRLKLAAAQGDLKLGQAQLDELKSTRPNEIQQAAAMADAAQAARDYAESTFQRIRRLYERGSATSDEYQSAQSTLDGAEATLKDRQAALRVLEEGKNAKYRQAEATVEVQQVVVDQLKDELSKHTIVSRFDGYMVAEHTEIGAWVQMGDPVAEVVALDQVDVLLYVLESQIPYVTKGAEVRVEIPALKRELRGTVAYIVPQADLRSRTFPVKVRIENEFQEGVPVIKAGMVAHAYLPSGPKRPALLVAKDALVLGGPRPLVYVVEQGSVRRVPVTLGVADGGLIEIQGEIQDGDLAVVLGNERLRPGMAVRITGRIDPRALDKKALEAAGE